MPHGFGGIVRNYVGDKGMSQVLANVTAFNATCESADTDVKGSAAYAATLGRHDT